MASSEEKQGRDGSTGKKSVAVVIIVLAAGIYGASQDFWSYMIEASRAREPRQVAPGLALVIAAVLSAIAVFNWSRTNSLRRRLKSVILVLLALVVLGVGLALTPREEESAEQARKYYPTTPDSLIREPMPERTPATANTKPAVSSITRDTFCGLDATVSRPLPKARICVVYWCKGEVYDRSGRLVRSDLQIKLRPRIINDSNQPLDVRTARRSSILLAVGGKNVNTRWYPPPLTRAAGDRPRRVSLDGRQYWALPPNVNDDVDLTPSNVYTGFASTWHTETVAPGSSFLETRRNADGSLLHSGNLVFQVPTAHGVARVVGLVLVDRRTGEVLSFQRQSDWGPKSSPTSF